MGGKHLKRLRAEKAKVQLKKKKLAKAQNITDTSFKVKKISLVQQLAPRADGTPVTSKNLTLKELLNQLSHHNTTVQGNALSGIKELLSNNVQLLQGLSLRQIVTRVLELAVVEQEQKVRRSAISLLSWILVPLSPQIRSPFVSLLNKQVPRALTHIHIGTQKDALRLVDLLLAVSLEEDLPKLYPLLNLLLRLVTMTGASVPARHVVIRRILAVSTAVFNLKPSSSITPINEVSQAENPWPLTSVYKSMARLPLCGTDTGSSVWSVEKVQILVSELMKALIGAWTECSTDNYLADASANLLQLVVQTIKVFMDFFERFENGSMKSWFISSFKKPIGKNFFTHFPYLSLEAEVRAPRQPDPSLPDAKTDLSALNLSLANLYTWFRLKLKAIEAKVQTFVLDCLDIRPIPSEMHDLLRCLIMMPKTREQTIRSVAESYVKLPDTSLLPLLTLITNHHELSQFIYHPSVAKWIASLARNLSEINSEQVNLLAHLVSRESNGDLEEIVRKEMIAVLSREGPLNSFRKKVLHVIYWCVPAADLKEALLSEQVSEPVRRYLEEVLCS